MTGMTAVLGCCSGRGTDVLTAVHDDDAAEVVSKIHGARWNRCCGRLLPAAGAGPARSCSAPAPAVHKSRHQKVQMVSKFNMGNSATAAALPSKGFKHNMPAVE